MSFIAKLFIENTERQVLNANYIIRQSTNMYQRPDAKPRGGIITIKIESSSSDHDLWEWAISPTMMKNGYIRFYKHDGMSRFADLEFWDCYCVDYNETFSDSSSTPMLLQLTLSAGIQRFKNIIFEKPWKITDLSNTAVEPTVLDRGEEEEEVEEPTKEITEIYFTDMNDVRISEIEGTQVKLVVNTTNMIGEIIELDLSEEESKFKYQGEILENNILRSYQINTNSDMIVLDVFEDNEPQEDEADEVVIEETE